MVSNSGQALPRNRDAHVWRCFTGEAAGWHIQAGCTRIERDSTLTRIHASCGGRTFSMRASRSRICVFLAVYTAGNG